MPSYKAVQVVDPPNTKLVELPALPSATPGHIVVQNTFACVSPVDVLVNSNSFPGMIKPVPFTTGLEGGMSPLPMLLVSLHTNPVDHLLHDSWRRH